MARSAHPEETERRILDSARRLFIEKGYEKTSIQDILNDLGDLSKGGLYHHFKSKEAILDRLNDDDWAESTHLRDELMRRQDLSALGKLRALIFSSLEDTGHMDLVRSQMAALDDPVYFTVTMRFWSQGLPESFRPLIDEGTRDGSIPTTYPEEAAQMLALLCNYWLMPHFYPAAQDDMERRVRCLATMLESIGVPLFDEELIERAAKGLTALASSDNETSHQKAR